MECKNCDFWEDGECHDSDEFIDEDGIDSCRYREGSFLKPSINKSKLNDGLCALLETWKEVLKGFDRLIEAEEVRDLRNMLIGSKNATKEMVEQLERFIKENT